MSAKQLGKIQVLEKQLEPVEGHPRGINIKQTPAFIQIPDTKSNFKHFERIEIAKEYSDLQNSQTYNGKLLKRKEHRRQTDDRKGRISCNKLQRHTEYDSLTPTKGPLTYEFSPYLCQHLRLKK
jgi:hypothetical protein